MAISHLEPIFFVLLSLVLTEVSDNPERFIDFSRNNAKIESNKSFSEESSSVSSKSKISISKYVSKPEPVLSTQIPGSTILATEKATFEQALL